MVAFGFEAANSQTGSKSGIPAGNYFFLGSVALISAAGEFVCSCAVAFPAHNVSVVIFGAGVWLFIAAASLFLARPQ